MFVSPFSFRGRIGRLEYVLSVLIACVLNYGLVFFIKFWGRFDYDGVDTIWNHLYSFVYTVCTWVYTLCFWFGWAQSIKRCHDMGRSGWCILIPFYGLVMLFVQGTEGDNKYGPAPGSDVAADSVDNSGTMRNPYMRFYLCLIMLTAGGVFAAILKMVYLNIWFEMEALSDIRFWIDNVIWTIWMLGLVLLFHYRKVAFYVVSVVGLYYLGHRIYDMIVNYDKLFFDFYIGFVLNASVLFLYPMLKKTSEWENLENIFKNLSWKSVLLYWFVIEFGMACYYFLAVVSL